MSFFAWQLLIEIVRWSHPRRFMGKSVVLRRLTYGFLDSRRVMAEESGRQGLLLLTLVCILIIGAFSFGAISARVCQRIYLTLVTCVLLAHFWWQPPRLMDTLFGGNKSLSCNPLRWTRWLTHRWGHVRAVGIYPKHHWQWFVNGKKGWPERAVCN